MEIIIRHIEKKDWRFLRDIYNEWRTENTYSVPVNTLSDLQAKRKTNMLLKDGINLVAEDNGRVIGLLESSIGKLPKTKHTIYSNQMNVSKEYRRKGVGKKLFLELLILAKKNKIKMIYLHVVATNVPAISLYKKMGFKKTGKVLNEYKFGNKYVDNVIMCKFL